MILRKVVVFIIVKYREIFKDVISQKDITLLKDKNFVIVSDNCWGGSLYQWYKRPYNSPFVGLEIYPDCYLKLLTNFEYYMQQNLRFINLNESKYPKRNLNYPLGIIDDVEIHFRHFKNEEEARVKWERRTQRMLKETNRDNYFFKMCSSLSEDDEHILKFHNLPFKNKISFSTNRIKSPNVKYHVCIFERSKINIYKIPNGKKLFKLTFLYFDVNKWLLSNSQ